jgi:peptide/nickel transport system permease protein
MIARLILGRCVSALVTLIAISIIVFAMVQMLPGDVASMVLGRFASETAKEALRQQLHLYQPAAWRYLRWLAGLLTGNLGDDLSSQQPIAVIIAPALVNTLVLSGAALAIYLPLTLSVAGVQAFYRYGGIDHGLSTVTMIGASIPEFLMSILFLVMFVVVVPVLPAVSFVDEHTSLIGWLSALALPAVVLAIVMSVYGIRMLRGNLIEILQSDFIQVALLRGLSPGRVLIRHALPNALIPTLNVTALNLGYLIGGVVVVEKVFAFPGFGSLMVDAVSFRDVPLVEATVMIAAAIYVAANLVADLMAIVLNPKLRRTS